MYSHNTFLPPTRHSEDASFYLICTQEKTPSPNFHFKHIKHSNPNMTVVHLDRLRARRTMHKTWQKKKNGTSNYPRIGDSGIRLIYARKKSTCIEVKKKGGRVRQMMWIHRFC